MPPFQNTQALRPAAGFPGGMADMAEWNANSGFVTGTTLEPGHPVQYGAAERSFVAFTTGTFAGILRGHITAAPGGVFTEGEMVAAIDEGHIFGRANGVATRGQPVYWTPSLEDNVGGYGNAGTILIPGAEFLTTGAEDDVVIINLRKVPGLLATPDNGV